jgi:DNA-binding transcriptional regulator YdaS (Cro superfamily)
VAEDKVRRQTLHRASEILGGAGKLRTYLGVSALALSVWMTGSEPAPTDVFLRAVDVIVDRELEDLKRSTQD